MFAQKPRSLENIYRDVPPDRLERVYHHLINDVRFRQARKADSQNGTSLCFEPSLCQDSGLCAIIRSSRYICLQSLGQVFLLRQDQNRMAFQGTTEAFSPSSPAEYSDFRLSEDKHIGGRRKIIDDAARHVFARQRRIKRSAERG